MMLENFIEVDGTKTYAEQMCEAAKNECFIKRTLEVQKEFEKTDAETYGFIVDEYLEW